MARMGLPRSMVGGQLFQPLRVGFGEGLDELTPVREPAPPFVLPVTRVDVTSRGSWTGGFSARASLLGHNRRYAARITAATIANTSQPKRQERTSPSATRISSTRNFTRCAV